jgi:hypothetical protein
MHLIVYQLLYLLEILSNENAPIANVSICVGGTGSLVANCSGNSSRWYTTATGGIQLDQVLHLIL